MGEMEVDEDNQTDFVFLAGQEGADDETGG
jgi:hypothetical protein